MSSALLTSRLKIPFSGSESLNRALEVLDRAVLVDEVDDGQLFKRSGASVVGVSPNAVTDGLTVTQSTLGSDVVNFTSTATGDDPNYRVVQGRVVTTDAVTAQTIITLALTLNTVYLVEARVVGRVTASTGTPVVGNGDAQIQTALVRRSGAGAVIIGQSQVFAASADGGTGVLFVASGNNILVQVTGQDANTTIVWHCTAIIQNLST